MREVEEILQIHWQWLLPFRAASGLIKIHYQVEHRMTMPWPLLITVTLLLHGIHRFGVTMWLLIPTYFLPFQSIQAFLSFWIYIRIRILRSIFHLILNCCITQRMIGLFWFSFQQMGWGKGVILKQVKQWYSFLLPMIRRTNGVLIASLVIHSRIRLGPTIHNWRWTNIVCISL